MIGVGIEGSGDALTLLLTWYSGSSSALRLAEVPAVLRSRLTSMVAGSSSADSGVDSAELEEALEIGKAWIRAEGPRSEASELVSWVRSWLSGLSI